METLHPSLRGKLVTVVAAMLVLWMAAPLFSAWVPIQGQLEGTPPEWRVLSSTPSSTVIEFTLNGYWVEEITEEGSQYVRLHVPGDHGTTQRVGSPALPTLSKMVGLPATGIVNVRVVEIDKVNAFTADIYPFQTPLRENEVRTGFDRDDAAYRTSALYPESWITAEDPGIWRDLRVSRMSLQPFHVNSATGELEIAHHMVVEVQTGGAGGINPMTRGPHPVRPHFYNMYQAAVINFEHLGYTLDNLDEDPGTQYLVITNPECLDAIEPLTDFRHAQGLKVEIRTLTPDFDEPQEFKTYITSLYHSTGLEYVLMVGDAYISGPPDVPMFWWQPESPGTYSDSWYTCVDPGDPMDHYAELAIGRIVYDTIQELEDQIDKTMLYLQAGDTTGAWQENTLLVAHSEQYPLKYTQCCEEIRQFPYSIQVPTFITAYGGAGATNQDVIDCVNQDGVGILNYRGHGSDTEWWQWGPTGSFSEVHISQLTNFDRLFVHFDICCDNMNIVDHMGDCFCESMMKHEGASVAVISAIIPSYTIPNHDFDKYLYRGVYEEGITNIGYTSNYANISVLVGHGSIGRSNVRTYLWLGDAAIDVITENPAPLVVDYPVGTNIGNPNLDITVEDALGAPVEGAMVCVTNDSVYSRGFTDALGEVTIVMDPAPMIGGTLDLMVTGHNFRPFNAQIDIIMGYGDLEGSVTDAATALGIEGATVTVIGPDMFDITNTSGSYLIEEIPAWTYDVTVEAEGYIGQTVTVVIDSAGVTQQDFDMLHAECALDVTTIHEMLNPEGEVQVDVTLSNDGNGPLDFTIESDFNPLGLPDPPADFSEVLWEENLSSLISDPFLHGIELAWGEYWIAGSGGGSNYTFYRYDLDWQSLGTAPQPVSQVLGVRDMTFDGEYLWVGDRDSILCLDQSAQVVHGIPGPHNPNRALAYNRNNSMMYVADRTADVYEIDPTDGSVVQTWDNSLDIKGLAFHPDIGEDGMLYLFTGGGGDSVCAYTMDVTSGEQTFIGRLAATSSQYAGGCTITNGLDPARWTFLGMLTGSDDYAQAYNLGWRTGWLTIDPDSGTVAGGDDVTITATLASSDYQEGDYIANLIVHHNALGNADTIDVTMTVTYTGVSDVEAVLPTQFRLDQAYPNPFNPTTTIPYALRETGQTKLAVYNVLGQQVALLVDEVRQAGEHRVFFDGRQLSSGVYFYRLEAGDFVKTRKVVLMK